MFSFSKEVEYGQKPGEENGRRKKIEITCEIKRGNNKINNWIFIIGVEIGKNSNKWKLFRAFLLLISINKQLRKETKNYIQKKNSWKKLLIKKQGFISYTSQLKKKDYFNS